MAKSNGSVRSENSKLMDPDTYFKRMIQPDTRPGVWRWEDIIGTLDEMDKHPKRYPAYRRFAALVNTDFEGAPGASPADRVVDYLAGMTDRFAIRDWTERFVPHGLPV